MKKDWTIVGITILGILFWLAVVRPPPVRKAIRALEAAVGRPLLPRPPASSRKKKARTPPRKSPPAPPPSNQPAQ